MKVREKIAQKKKAVKEKDSVKEKNPIAVPAQMFEARCIQCRVIYQTTKELDLDGKGRCGPCQEERDRFLADIEARRPHTTYIPPPSFNDLPRIPGTGILDVSKMPLPHNFEPLV